MKGSSELGAAADSEGGPGGDAHQTTKAWVPDLGEGVHLQVLGIIFHKIALKVLLLPV